MVTVDPLSNTELPGTDTMSPLFTWKYETPSQLSYHAPVNPQLPRHSFDRSSSELVLPSDRLRK